MGILDDAIKEHLELKKQHGADASELKQLEDEAFGAAERPGAGESQPDAAAEAPTEFMEQPPLEPDEGESPAMEHEAISEPEESELSAGPSTAEREAIAEQPTEMYDVGEELATAEPAPSEEELLEEEAGEPRLAPADPLSDLDEDDGEEALSLDDEEFWDEKRLSDELDQALEGPSEPEPDEPGPAAEPAEPEPELTAEPEDPAPPPAADEDVLEETPDFLEEAPEDDRLWFEQKPPKDFDFDD